MNGAMSLSEFYYLMQRLSLVIKVVKADRLSALFNFPAIKFLNPIVQRSRPINICRLMATFKGMGSYTGDTLSRT